MSPDTQSVIEAIERIQGHVFVPENIEHTIYHFISDLGKSAIKDCAGKSLEFKMGYIEGWSRSQVGDKE